MLFQGFLQYILQFQASGHTLVQYPTAQGHACGNTRS